MGPIIPAKLIGHTKNFKLKKVKRKHFKKFLATVFSDPLIYKSVLISNGLISAAVLHHGDSRNLPPPPDIVFVCFSDLVKPSNNWNKKFGFSPTKRYNTVKGKLVCKKKIETIFKLALNYTNFLLYINLYIKPFLID